MSIYDDRVRKHSVNNEIETLKKTVEKLIYENTDETATEHLNRLLEVSVYAESIISDIDHVLVPKSVLDKMNNIVQNIRGDLTNFESNNQVDLLANANNRADNLLVQLQQIPTKTEDTTSKYIPETATRYHESINNILNEVNRKKQKLEKHVNDLSGRLENMSSSIDKLNGVIENQKSRLDAAISEFQKQFSEAEDRRRENFENHMNSINEQFRSNQKKLNDQIGNFTNEKEKEVTDAIDEYQNEAKDTLEEFKAAADSILSKHKETAEETIDFLSTKKEDAVRLLNVIGNIGFTGNYNKIADEEKKTANSWRFSAIIFMALGIIVIGTIIFNIGKTGFDWKLVLARVAVTITIFVPALYAARESSRHRQREMYNRKMELELASIGPFLELLPDVKKVELKSQLTAKFFGQPQGATSEKGETVSVNTLFKLLDKILTNLTRK